MAGTRFGSRIGGHQPVVVSGQGGSGTTCPPTFVLPEYIDRYDAIRIDPMQFPESRSATDDELLLNPMTLTDSTQRLDEYRLPSITATIVESYDKSDTATFTVGPLSAQSPTGTPDADDWGDAWTDNTIGQTGTNHGATSPLNMSSGTAGVGVKLAWVEINLTRFTGLTATGGSAENYITGVFTNASVVLAATITLRGGSNGGTRPFTESTITQSTQPSTPTGFVVTANLPAGATNQTLTFGLSDAEMTAILGNWAILQFQTSSTVTATPDTMVSREGANPMAIHFKATV